MHEWSAVLLAAGLSRRMGEYAKNKLLLPWGAQPLVCYAAALARRAGIEDLVVVLGHDAERLHRTLAPYKPHFVYNEHYAEGQGSSVAVGTAALSKASRGCYYLMGDQALTAAEILTRLAAQGHETAIVQPLYGEQRGAPVLFGRAFYPELCRLQGDLGGRQVLAAHPEAVRFCALDAGLAVPDIDDWQTYQALRAAQGGDSYGLCVDS